MPKSEGRTTQLRTASLLPSSGSQARAVIINSYCLSIYDLQAYQAFAGIFLCRQLFFLLFTKRVLQNLASAVRLSPLEQKQKSSGLYTSTGAWPLPGENSYLREEKRSADRNMP